MLKPKIVFASMVLVALMAPAASFADVPDPAIATVSRFDDALLASMHHDTSHLADSVDAAFNLNVMASFIVGPSWAQISTDGQGAVTASLRRYLVARFANEFDSFNGERFQTDTTVQTRGLDKLVQTQIIHTDGTASHLNYRMRAYHDQWRIIDVYLDGVSQLTTERADLAAVVQGGAPALVAHLDAATRAIR